MIKETIREIFESSFMGKRQNIYGNIFNPSNNQRNIN